MANASSNQVVIPSLAAYQKDNRSVILTKPGYDVYFYSRADASLNPYPLLKSQTKFQTFSQVTPTFKISSNADGTDVPIINMMQIANRVNNQTGHQATIELVEPQGVEYFKPTLGDKTKAPPDYDHSWLVSTPTNSTSKKNTPTQHRIGTMDTVIIKLNNSTLIGNQQVSFVKETVFRGVISNIVRTKSPQGGSIIRLECLDFSEFMRQMFAIPEGFFSTVSFSITGRGLANNLLRYANKTLSGSNDIPGISAAITKIFDFFTSGTQADGTVAGQTNSGAPATNHAMICPPFFWQEYAFYSGKGQPDDIFGGQSGLQNQVQSLIQNFTAKLVGSQNPEAQDTSIQTLTDSIGQDLKNAFNALGTSGAGALAASLTPEDKDAIDSYQSFISDGIIASQATKLNASSAISSTNSSAVNLNLQKNAWILSDLYLEKGLITFEEQQIWATIYQAASRSNREAYFDIAPKLTAKAPISMFDTAGVPELGINNKGNTKYNPNNLDDIHPNIGILKYRLSPCFLPYPLKGPSPDKSEFRYYDITDDMIMSTETSEDEQMVFSAVYGFADSFTNQTIPDYATGFATGAAKYPFVYAHSIDPNIEKRLGYRFMTEHDNKIKIPVMMYLVSYILLEKSQLSMFSQVVTLTGNPTIQPGSIVRMNTQNADYYCTEVQHTWSLEGYTTTLQLQFGHQTGVAPAAMTGVGQDEEFTQLSTMACQNGANQVAKYVSSSVNIGGINEQCLISAMWEYMTCRANSSDALKKCTKAYETAHPYVVPPDWIDLVHTFDNSTIAPYSNSQNPFFSISPTPSVTSEAINPKYINMINSAISPELASYNVTLNLVLNIIGHESSWCQNAKHINDNGTVDYGWFQINNAHFTEGIDDVTACTNFQKACFFALNNVLLPAMRNNNPNKTGGVPFLNGLTAYNQGQNSKFLYSAYRYVNDVLGDAQVTAIAKGRPPSNGKPGTIRTGLVCQDGTSAADLTKWPFDVYGPIGMHPSSLATIGGTKNLSDAKNQLLTWDNAMTLSVKYMDHLLRKYANTSFLPSLVPQDTFSKVIAAWFNDEQDISGTALAILPNVTSQIKSLYTQCIGCTGINQATISANSNSEMKAAYKGIQWQCPLGAGALITSPFNEYRGVNSQGGQVYHQGIDIVTPTGSVDAGAPVVAPADGIVTGYTTGGKGGLAMSINHTLNGQLCGAQSLFYDIGRYAPGISAGSVVKGGQTVAYLPRNENEGSDGGGVARIEKGIHLHWQVGSQTSITMSTYIASFPTDPNQFVSPPLNSYNPLTSA